MADFTALENVMMPMLIGRQNKTEAKDRAEKILSAVGLSHRITHRPSALSGGERQRVAIARALVNNPALVLADEPTGNLDHKTTESIFELIQTLNSEQNIAFLLVTHDMSLAQKTVSLLNHARRHFEGRCIMNTPFFISWRYQRGKQKNPLVALISKFSAIGIALGVAVLIVGLSAMNGFERELNSRILAVVPHAEITVNPQGNEATLSHWQKLAERLKTNKKITALSPFVSFTALVENGNKLKVVQVKGVDKQAEDQVSSLGKFVEGDGWQKFGRRRRMVLGSGIAKGVRIVEKQVDWVYVIDFSTKWRRSKWQQPNRERVQVTAILRLDGQLDHSYALLALPQAQELMGYREDQITGVELKVDDPFKVQDMDYSMLNDYPQLLCIQTGWQNLAICIVIFSLSVL